MVRPTGYKMLCAAVGAGDLDALGRGVRMDPDAAVHWKPIMDAAFTGRADMIEVLLDAGADPQSSVFAASYGGPEELCGLLDAHGADWNQRFQQRTPLMHLMRFRKPVMSVWLLEHGTDVHATDEFGRTALHWAALQGGRSDYLAALVEHCADPGSKDDFGDTPLDLAREKKRAKAIAYLESIR